MTLPDFDELLRQSNAFVAIARSQPAGPITDALVDAIRSACPMLIDWWKSGYAVDEHPTYLRKEAARLLAAAEAIERQVAEPEVFMSAVTLDTSPGRMPWPSSCLRCGRALDPSDPDVCDGETTHSSAVMDHSPHHLSCSPSHGQRWTQHELDVVADLSLTDRQCADLLGRSDSAVAHKRVGLRRPRRSGAPGGSISG